MKTGIAEMDEMFRNVRPEEIVSWSQLAITATVLHGGIDIEFFRGLLYCAFVFDNVGDAVLEGVKTDQNAAALACRADIVTAAECAHAAFRRDSRRVSPQIELKYWLDRSYAVFGMTDNGRTLYAETFKYRLFNVMFEKNPLPFLKFYADTAVCGLHTEDPGFVSWLLRKCDDPGRFSSEYGKVFELTVREIRHQNVFSMHMN